MKKLVGLLYDVWEFYEEGMELIYESWIQIAHITCIIGILIVLWSDSAKFHAPIWSMISILYLILLAVVGYCKFWEPGCKENKRDKLQAFYTKIYFICCGLLTVVGCLTSGIIQTAIIVGVFILLSSLFYAAGEVLICEFAKRDRKKGFFEKIRDWNPYIYYVVYVFFVCLMILIPLTFVNINPIIKAFIVIIYMALMPIVALLADNGVDIVTIFH